MTDVYCVPGVALNAKSLPQAPDITEDCHVRKRQVGTLLRLGLHCWRHQFTS